MGETHHQTTQSSRFGIRNSVGEIVEVEGGHIVRSTGRKDRHSKVCTAKGPRDRRVRLSAHTAIQFYDVQDRLGYDRPSKAVDWLIKKAKVAIDELQELPAWKPPNSQSQEQQCLNVERENSENPVNMVGNGNDLQNLQNPQMGETVNNKSSSFLPPSMDSDSFADTIKSFFPLGASVSTDSPSSTIQFQNFSHDFLSRTNTQNRDLRLSLQSLRDPILLHHQQAQQHHTQTHQNENVLFSGTTHLCGFDGSSTGWVGHQTQPVPESNRFQRMIAWSSNISGAETGNAGAGNVSGGFIFNSPPNSSPPPQLQPLFGGENQFFSQRGPLQSSTTPSIRAWIDTASSIVSTDHHQQQQHYQIPPSFHQSSSFPGYGFSGEFSEFRIPARIQGEEEHDGISDKPPSSASSDSRH